MPDISTIVTPDGQTRNIKDSTARNNVVLLEQMNGAKNRVHINNGTYTGTNPSRYVMIPIDPISGSVTVFIGQLTSTAGSPDRCAIVFKSANGSNIVTDAILRGTNVTKVVTLDSTAAYIAIYPADSWESSLDETLTWSNLMVCSTDEFTQFPSYQSYERSNYTLTSNVQSIVDINGSKNIIDYNVEDLKELNSTSSGWNWSINANTYTCEYHGITYTFNPDKSITLTGTASSLSYIRLLKNFMIPAGTYVLSGCPPGGSTDTFRMYFDGIPNGFECVGIPQQKIISSDTLATWCTIAVNANVVTNFTFYPMLCTKEAFDISSTYHPYSISNNELTDKTTMIERANGCKNYLDFNTLYPAQSNNYASINYTNKTVTSNTDDTYASFYFGIWRMFAGSIIENGGTFANPSVSHNGIWYISFIKTAEFDQLMLGHNGKSVDCKVIAPVDNLTNGVAYVCAINITNYLKASGPYSFKDIMICKRDDFLASKLYQDFALSNNQLTRSLGVCCDSISKNKLDWLNGHWNSAGTTEISGVRFTNNPDGSVTVDGTCTASAGNSSTYTLKLIWPEQNDGHLFENCVLAGCPNQNGNVHISIERYTSPYTLYAKNSGSAATEIDPIPSNIGILIFIRVPSGKTVTNQVVRPMICDKNYWYSSRKYQPHALDNVAITPALINIVDSGQKNLLTESTASNVTGYKDISVNVPKGEYVFRIESLSTTAPDISEVKLGFYKTPNLVTSANIYIGTAVRRFVYVSIPSAVDVVRIFAVNSSDTSNTYKLSFSGAMLCDRSLWDVSQKFVPYRPSYKETVEQVAENENNISITDITDHFRALEGYTIQSGISTVYRQGKHVFGTLSIKINSGNLPTTLTEVALNGTDLPNSTTLLPCGCGVDEMSIDSIGACYYNNNLGIIKCKDTVSTNTCFNLQLDYITY